jgi:HD-like signal output (HDOD) protein
MANEPQPLYADLLPVPTDPAKAEMRLTLLHVLESEGEILPSANSPRGKLWHLVNSPDSSVEECAEVIQLDSALASRIFRVANSSAYGVGAETIIDAVQLLGLKFVREQVFNAGIFKQYSGWELPPQWDLFWLRNILVARLCERISGLYSRTNGSEYLAGLIHDMGWLFLASHMPEQYGLLFSSGMPVAEAEREILPFGHAEISAAMAARSKLPARAVDAILYHHDPIRIRTGAKVISDKSAYFLCLILNISDRLADNCGLDMFEPASQTIEEVQASEEVKWLANFGALPDLRAATEEELQKSKEIFDIFFSNRAFK